MMYHTSQGNHKRRRIFKITIPLFFICLLFGAVLLFLTNPSENNKTSNKTSNKEINPGKGLVKPYISISHSMIRQGDPAFITVVGATSTASVKSFTFDNRPLYIFTHEGQVSALLGVELRAIPGNYELVLTFNNGKQIKENFVISKRENVREHFDIPEKLGGNNPESERQLISTLAEEGKIINALPVVWEKLWTEKFSLPLKIPFVVSDEYGYTRLIGKFTTMPHKGTDLEAPMGTPVYAMNRGIVKFAGNLRNYGNTVVLDHGTGLQTVYMHLSQINVILDQKVEKGDLIALSGDSGYTLNPHLHLTIRIWDISIDPVKFIELLGEK